MTERVKGAIYCPICHKSKAIAFESASGKASIQCPKCGRFITIDLGEMTASEGEAYKGANKLMTAK